ncbi:unnamed protein product [Moneuplotes crassus]|uniref:Exportin-T n=1 Tax=Euplotes crassus TaxID=5936 RepID=A0AAD1XWU8_EUPCR|nr:unnamed protein product [Moneuplotes crassus]
MDFSNVEKAIEIISNPMAHTDPEMKTQANEYLIEIPRAHYAEWKNLFAYLGETTSDHTKFWILQALSEIVKDCWLGLNTGDKSEFGAIAFEFLKHNYNSIIPVHHFCQKYSYLFAMIIKLGYPDSCSNVFDQLETMVKESEESLSFLKFTFAVMKQINSEIVERESYTTNDDLQMATRVKDAMRLGDVTKIINLAQIVLEKFDQLPKELVIGAIDTLKDLIDWNDLALFEPAFEIITNFCENKDFQQSALYCFYAFMKKGMDPSVKIKVIKDINIVTKIKSITLDSDDLELCQTVCDIIKKMGFLILEIVETAPSDSDYQDDAQGLLLELLLLNVMFLECDDVKSLQYVAQFVNAMVLYIKKLQELPDQLAEIVFKIQDLCIQKCEYPDWFSFEEKDLSEDEEIFNILRCDLSNLFRNTIAIPGMKERALKKIDERLDIIKENFASMTPNQIECPLFLLGEVYDIISREDNSISNPVHQAICSKLLSIDFLSTESNEEPSKEKAVVYAIFYEVCVKYGSYFIHFPEAIPHIIGGMMSEKGILHPWKVLSSKSCYYLLRFICRVKDKLTDYAELIYTNSRKIIEMYEEGKTNLYPRDIENVYEIIGNMLENFQMPPEEIKKILSYYFELIWNKMNNTTVLQGNIELIRRMNFLIKSLKPRSASASQDILKGMSENLLTVFQAYINSPINDCIVFVQKTLTLIGVEMFDNINNYIEAMLAANTQIGLDSCFKLMTFVIIELEEQSFELFDKHIVTFFDRLGKLEFPEENKSDESKDKLSVFVNFIKMINSCVHKNPIILISGNSGAIFESLMQFFAFLTTQSVHKNFRKEILHILRTMLTEFSGCTLDPIKNIHLGNKSKIEERKIVGNPDYETNYDTFIKISSEISFEIFNHIDIKDPIDINCVYLTSLLHVLLLHNIPSFSEIYQSKITKIHPSLDFTDLATKITLFLDGKLKVPDFKQYIRSVFIPK